MIVFTANCRDSVRLGCNLHLVRICFHTAHTLSNEPLEPFEHGIPLHACGGTASRISEGEVPMVVRNTVIRWGLWVI